MNQQMPAPPVKAWSPELQALADACGQGDADAMLRLSEYIRTEPVYKKAVPAINMWLLRSAIYGNSEAQERVRAEVSQNRLFLKNCAVPYRNMIPGKNSVLYTSGYSGFLLNVIGLLAFQPGKSYTISGINENRFMIVWESVDYDPADEDGFGREEYYNMFCLDEYFQLIPGVPMTRNLSSRDSNNSPDYLNMVRMAEEAMSGRDLPPLWLDFLPSETVCTECETAQASETVRKERETAQESEATRKEHESAQTSETVHKEHEAPQKTTDLISDSLINRMRKAWRDRKRRGGKNS